MTKKISEIDSNGKQMTTTENWFSEFSEIIFSENTEKNLNIFRNYWKIFSETSENQYSEISEKQMTSPLALFIVISSESELTSSQLLIDWRFLGREENFCVDYNFFPFLSSSSSFSTFLRELVFLPHFDVSQDTELPSKQ